MVDGSLQVGGKAQLQFTYNKGGVKRAVGVERKPLSQLQPVVEEVDELEQMMDSKDPVVLKTENSIGVSNISHKTDHGDSLCYDVRLVLSLISIHVIILVPL